MLYCRLIYMLSTLYVRLTIKVKGGGGIPESFKVGWYPHKITGSSHLKPLDLRTGVVSYLWALWKYLQKADPCQLVIKHHLSIYFIFICLFNVYSIRCLKTRIKNSYRFTKHLLKSFSPKTGNGVSGGACRLTQPLAARFLSLDANTSFLRTKKGWTLCLSPEIPFLGI